MRDASGRDDAAGEALWRFSLALYARPGVADALIGLQDLGGRDVNLILFALWLGATRAREIDAAGLAAAASAIAPLNAVVAELRERRRRLKAATEIDLQALRRRLLALELAAERRVQYRLAASRANRTSPGRRDPLGAAEANLARCLGGDAGSAEARVLRAALAGLMHRG